jgi:hypothetical protein
MKDVVSKVKQRFEKKTARRNDSSAATESMEQEANKDAMSQETNKDNVDQAKEQQSNRKEGLSRLKSISQRCRVGSKKGEWKRIGWGQKNAET